LGEWQSASEQLGGVKMEIAEARSIVDTLANGIDPATGEILPNASPYNEPKVIRALFTVLGSTKGARPSKKTLEQLQEENLASGRPRNAGLPWPDELKAEVAGKFESGMPLNELARCFERTKGAILSELKKQGLIDLVAAD
jgi:hypothetical protein